MLMRRMQRGWNNLAAVYLRIGEEGMSKGDVSHVSGPTELWSDR